MPKTQPFRLTIEEKDFILKKRRLENEKITNSQYSKSLKKIKEVLIMFQEKGEL